MAAQFYRTLILLVCLKTLCAQQNINSNQNFGQNNVGLQQLNVARPNSPNNMNQIPNGGFNVNLSQAPNLQQLQSEPGNIQQSFNLPGNFQQVPSTLNNLELPKQSCNQAALAMGNNPGLAQSLAAMQFNNGGLKQNMPMQQGQNMASNLAQLTNMPVSSSPLSELAALKGQPSLLSLLASQGNAPSQQIATNLNPGQNSLTDVQKQFLVKAFQSQSPPNQPIMNFLQSQGKSANQPCSSNQQLGYGNTGAWPNNGVQAQVLIPQQPQQITVTPVKNQPPYITVQAQPLTTYSGIPQSVSPLRDGEPSMYNFMLPELQATGPEYNLYNSYPVEKKSPKAGLKTLIPLILEMLKEKKCGCRTCGCPNNEGQLNPPDPFIYGGNTNQKRDSPGTEDSAVTKKDAKEVKSKSSTKGKKVSKHEESEEISEENDSEYTEDSSE